jgi:hypothetical protein
VTLPSVVLLRRRLNGVVPFTVELVPRKRHRRQLLVTHLDPKRVAAAVQLRADPQARVGRGRPEQLDDRLVAGERPVAPVVEIALNSRCSIRFHLAVPGGRWQTVIASPVSAASRASSVFHALTR